jgi:BioD-like phosphotransacetylase family protein
MALRSIYIVGTSRNVGKTTTALGLLHCLRNHGLSVGYIKPLGQRIDSAVGHLLHEDARLVGSYIGMTDVDQVDMPVALTPGKVEEAVHDLHTKEMLQRIHDSYDILARSRDIVVVEGMGHVAMGSCLALSAADVCRSLGAKALLVSGGGIGRAIDDISLCATFLQARGAELAGVLVNKVWPEKYDRIKEATTLGLANLGIRSFGTVPFHEALASPTMKQVHECVGGTLLGGEDHMDHHVQHTIIAAMQADRMIRYIKGNTLVITPGDREDSILAALRAHMLGDPKSPAVAGLIVTGDLLPDSSVLTKIKDFHLPVISVKGDTFTTASKIVNTAFKIPPDDQARVQVAVSLMSKHIDVDGLLAALSEDQPSSPGTAAVQRGSPCPQIETGKE